MTKTKKSPSRRYLKALGIIELILAVLEIVLGIVLLVMKDHLSATDLGLVAYVTEAITEDIVKIVAGSVLICSGVAYAVLGWLMLRASAHPQKSTLLLILTMFSTFSSTYSLISAAAKGTSVASAASGIFTLTINVLALIAIFNIRHEANK